MACNNNVYDDIEERLRKEIKAVAPHLMTIKTIAPLVDVENEYDDTVHPLYTENEHKYFKNDVMIHDILFVRFLLVLLILHTKSKHDLHQHKNL